MADPPPPHPTCAACKHQGRTTCPPDCPLAPYFPADKPESFQYANRLFGIDNILRRLEAVGPDPGIRNATMTSIVYSANARAADPVHGAYGVIRDLEQQLDRLKAENAILRNLQNQQAQPSPPAADVALEPFHQPSMPPALQTAVKEREEPAALEDGHYAYAPPYGPEGVHPPKTIAQEGKESAAAQDGHHLASSAPGDEKDADVAQPVSSGSAPRLDLDLNKEPAELVTVQRPLAMSDQAQPPPTDDSAAPTIPDSKDLAALEDNDDVDTTLRL